MPTSGGEGELLTTPDNAEGGYTHVAPDLAGRPPRALHYLERQQSAPASQLTVDIGRHQAYKSDSARGRGGPMFDYFTEFGSLNHFKSGHITLLRTGIAYRLYADALLYA